MAVDKRLEAKAEHLKRRCMKGGLLFVGGLTFAFTSLQFDKSIDSPAIWGIYAMVVGSIGCVTYMFRYFIHLAGNRNEAQRAGLITVFVNGGIR